MPTITTRTIGNDPGRDYATIALWEADTDNDLVGTDTVEIGELYFDNATALPGNVTIFGATTDATRYRELRFGVGHRYDVTTGTGARIESADFYALIAQEENFRFTGFAIFHTGGGSAISMQAGADATIIDGMYFSLGSSNANCNGILYSGSAPYGTVRNCIFEDVSGGTHNGYMIRHNTSGGVFENLVLNGNNNVQYCVGDTSGTPEMRNVAAFNATQQSFNAGTTGSNNYSDDALAPGPDSHANQTPTDDFADIPSQDYNPSSGTSVLVDNGIARTGYENGDYAGNPHGSSGSWEIGAYDFAGGPPPASPMVGGDASSSTDEAAGYLLREGAASDSGTSTDEGAAAPRTVAQAFETSSSTDGGVFELGGDMIASDSGSAFDSLAGRTRAITTGADTSQSTDEAVMLGKRAVAASESGASTEEASGRLQGLLVSSDAGISTEEGQLTEVFWPPDMPVEYQPTLPSDPGGVPVPISGGNFSLSSNTTYTLTGNVGTLTVPSSGSNIRVNGNGFSATRLQMPAQFPGAPDPLCFDISFYDIVVTGTGSTGNAIDCYGDRLLFNNVEVIKGVSNNQNYGIYSWGGANITVRFCRLGTTGEQACVRLVNCSNTAVFYCELTSDNKHCYRIHSLTRYSWISDATADTPVWFGYEDVVVHPEEDLRFVKCRRVDVDSRFSPGANQHSVLQFSIPFDGTSGLRDMEISDSIFRGNYAPNQYNNYEAAADANPAANWTYSNNTATAGGTNPVVASESGSSTDAAGLAAVRNLAGSDSSAATDGADAASRLIAAGGDSSASTDTADFGVVTVYAQVGSSGQADYATIGEWVTATSLDLVSLGRRYVARLEDQSFGEQVVVTGATVDQDHYRRIEALPDARSRPESDGGARILQLTVAMRVQEDYFQVEGVTAGIRSGSGQNVLIEANNVWFHACYFDASDFTSAGSENVVAVAGFDNAKITSCVGRGGDPVFDLRNGSGHTIQNTDAFKDKSYGGGTNAGIFSGTGTTVENCYAFGVVQGDDFDGTPAFAQTNASDDTTAPGAGSIVGQDPDFALEDHVNNDYRVAVGSGLRDEGTDLSASFLTDFGGRPHGSDGIWEIGAWDEAAALGPMTASESSGSTDGADAAFRTLGSATEAGLSTDTGDPVSRSVAVAQEFGTGFDGGDGVLRALTGALETGTSVEGGDAALRRPVAAQDLSGATDEAAGVRRQQLGGLDTGQATEEAALTATWQLSAAEAGFSTDTGTFEPSTALTGLDSSASTEEVGAALRVHAGGAEAGSSTESTAALTRVFPSASEAGASTDTGTMAPEIALAGLDAGQSTDEAQATGGAETVAADQGVATDTGDIAGRVQLSVLDAGTATDGVVSAATWHISSLEVSSSTDRGRLGNLSHLTASEAGFSTEAALFLAENVLFGRDDGVSIEAAIFEALHQIAAADIASSKDEGGMTRPRALIYREVIVTWSPDAIDAPNSGVDPGPGEAIFGWSDDPEEITLTQKTGFTVEVIEN
jgi:hypothetical protein